MKKILIIIITLVVICVGVYFVYKKPIQNNQYNENSSTQIANPASLNCSKIGGKLVIEKRGDGGEYGLCYFEDNKACEEWALLRGDCPVGGLKTTGYDTVDQKYCVWLGNKTTAEKDSVCMLLDGSKCSTLDFYNGKCPATN